MRWHSQWNGDSALTLFFEAQASADLTRYILALAETLQATFPDTFTETILAYQSLTLCFDVLSVDTDIIEGSIRQVIEKGIAVKPETATPLIEIPVCYQGVYAPDLESVAAYCNLSPVEVIQQHTQNDYRVNMLGFLPGFLYLSGLADALYCPRKATPSLNITAGAVGIGGNQTGIYPVDSPGGWHIIGHTPVAIFNPVARDVFIAQALDKIRFVPIDSATFEKIKRAST